MITGDEVLRGSIPERNAAPLSASLDRLGFGLDGVSVVGDDAAVIRDAVAARLRAGADLVVVSGGLGPTHDDLTMAAVAQATGRELALDAAALEMVTRRSTAITVSEAAGEAVRRKQATLPAGSRPLPPPGTAPGCLLVHDGSVIVVLPGPPWELRVMWERALAGEPELRALAERAAAPPERILRIHAFSESRLVEVLREPAAAGWEALELGVCARDGELEVTLRGDQGIAAAVEAALGAAAGPGLYSRDGRTLDEVVAGALTARGEMVAVAESCTGGGLGARLTASPGSSAYVAGGVIAYSNDVKTAVLGVDPAIIARDGAVSDRCARAMADGVRSLTGAAWGVSITGVAGPGGGTPRTPVGRVHIGVAGPDGTRATAFDLRGDREQVRARSVSAALHLLREALTGV